MGKVTMEGVQKILHLDTEYANFPTWEEPLQFEVDGVQVKAVATHKWREEFVRIVEPFSVEGYEYLQGFRPPLMALGIAMIRRRQALEAEGLTVRDDCIRMASNTYRLHSTYLRLKPEIDRAQEEFLSVFRDELDVLLNESTKAHERMSAGRIVLRQKLRGKQLEQKEYQVILTRLQKDAEQCRSKHYSLQFDVDHELNKIKMSFIHRALDERIDERPPLRLTNR